MFRQIRKLEQQLGWQRDVISHRETLGQIREWRKREEILWWQQARTDNLKYGDANIRWFHTRANMRRVTNSIQYLVDDNGTHLSGDAVWDVIIRGSQWLVGDGRSLNIWDNRWLPRPNYFRPITSHKEAFTCSKVSDLIDHNNVCWRESLVRDIFLLYDAGCILSIPLCSSSSEDKLIWHYHTQSIFSVKSTYHMLIDDSHTNQAGFSSTAKDTWKMLWKCVVPPESNCLDGGLVLGYYQRLPILQKGSQVLLWHALFMAMQKCQTSMLSLNVLWLSRFGMDVTPAQGCMKRNYDGGNMGKTTYGWGFVLRNHLGDIELAGAQHGPGFAGSLIEEARSCSYGLKCDLEMGVCNIIVEGDCLVLFQMLRFGSI
ncbi:hypothetical protein Cgig2_003231 [Carnegiea gigantea]|uniref:RNase H type-1 domain-containing protein n=1 Tax=Carnegiea gigantea TaxID=171969 RepID=A0A9Q1JTK1_9CARY|nr:hypothetical protein Cgig2_003231 [Carnegiea gigantea]